MDKIPNEGLGNTEATKVFVVMISIVVVNLLAMDWRVTLLTFTVLIYVSREVTGYFARRYHPDNDDFPEI